jgi:hypothetical protein
MQIPIYYIFWVSHKKLEIGKTLSKENPQFRGLDSFGISRGTPNDKVGKTALLSESK